MAPIPRNYEGGCLPEVPDDRDFLAGDLSDFLETPLADLPEAIFYKPESADLTSQGDSVACTAHAASNAVEATYFAQTGIPITIDALGQWDYQTKVHPKTSSMLGDQLASALKALLHRSDTEGGIPYKDIKEGVAVSPTKRLKIAGYAVLPKPLTFDDCCRALNAGHAVIISGRVLRAQGGGLSNFSVAKKTGWLSFPAGWKNVGGHAFAHLIGYDRKEGYGICGNSYGEDWGFWKDGTMRLDKKEFANLNPSGFVVFLDDSDSKIKKYFQQIRLAKAIYAIANDITELQLASYVVGIQRNAHMAAERLRALILLEEK